MRADHVDGNDSPHVDATVDFSDLQRTIASYGDTNGFLDRAAVKHLVADNPGLVV